MRVTKVAIAMAMLAMLGQGGTSWAQRAGQSLSIQYGKVTKGSEVDLRSAAVPASALVGGALGLASAGGKSSSKKARNALIGATASGAVSAASQGSQRGMAYEVDVGGGSTVQVVTDQRDIRVGDCVAVERTGDTANIRRVSAAYCDKATEASVKELASEARKNAEACALAKQQLVNATTPQAADMAGRKVTLLCND